DLGELDAAEQGRRIEAEAGRVQASLDLTAGPLLRAVLFGCGAGRPPRLVVVVHHLAVDAVSWPIVLEDLEGASEERSGGQGEVERWLEGRHPEEVARLPVDHLRGENTVGSTAEVGVALAAEETRRLLQEVPSAYRTQINDVLLSAVAMALSGWTGGGRVLVDL